MQISITRGSRNPDEDLNVHMYILPTKRIDARAYKVHGLSVSYEAGRKQLLNKNKEVLPAVGTADAAESLIEYLTGLCRSLEAPLLMVAHITVIRFTDQDSSFLLKVRKL